MKMLITLSKFDSKGSSGDIKKLPWWSGDPQELTRHLLRIDEITRHIKNDTLRLMNLEQSIPKGKRQLIQQCASYETARATLQLTAHGTQSIAGHQRSLLLSLSPPSNSEEQEQTLLLAVKYLGVAIEAQPSFAIYQMEALRIFQIFTPESRPLHIGALGDIIETQSAEQETDQPNLAPSLLKYITKARNAAQLMKAALQMDARIVKTTMQANRTQLSPSDNEDRGSEDGRAKWTGRAGATKVCTVCDTTSHDPACMWKCLEVIRLALEGSPVPAGPCKSCLKSPPGDRCKEKTCHEGRYRRSGESYEFFCAKCKTHKNIGRCPSCRKHQEKLTDVKTTMQANRTQFSPSDNEDRGTTDSDSDSDTDGWACPW